MTHQLHNECICFLIEPREREEGRGERGREGEGGGREGEGGGREGEGGGREGNE